MEAWYLSFRQVEEIDECLFFADANDECMMPDGRHHKRGTTFSYRTAAGMARCVCPMDGPDKAICEHLESIGHYTSGDSGDLLGSSQSEFPTEGPLQDTGTSSVSCRMEGL